MIQGWKKDNYIECIYTLRDFINNLPKQISSNEKRKMIVESFDFLTEDEIVIMTNGEIFNIIHNIQSLPNDEFIEALYKYGSCIINLFEDGYPIDPISYEKLTNYKDIGVYNGTGYNKDNIVELALRGSHVDPMTNIPLTVQQYEDFRDKSEYEGNIRDLMTISSSSSSGSLNVSRKISF